MQFTSAAPVVEEQKRMKAKVCVCGGGGVDMWSKVCCECGGSYICFSSHYSVTTCYWKFDFDFQLL